MIGTKTILYVEDNLVVAKAYKNLMEREGYTVTHSADGRDALGKIQSNERFDVVVLDLMLPGLDGMDILKEASTRIWGRKIPIIVLSSISLHMIRDEAQKYGASVFLHKEEVTPQSLLSEIGKVMQNQETSLTIGMVDTPPAKRKLTTVIPEDSRVPTQSERKEEKGFFKKLLGS